VIRVTNAGYRPGALGRNRQWPRDGDPQPQSTSFHPPKGTEFDSNSNGKHCHLDELSENRSADIELCWLFGA